MKSAKLIPIWEPLQSRSGATTVALSLATCLSWMYFQKTLLISFSDNEDLSYYLKGVKSIAYTLNDLAVYEGTIDANIIQMHVTAINNKLDVIGSMKTINDLAYIKDSALLEVIENASEIYDYIVLDVSKRWSEEIYAKATMNLLLLPLEERKIQELKQGNLKPILEGDTTYMIFNKIPLGIEKYCEELMRKMNFKKYRMLPINKYVHFSNVSSQTLYDFLVTHFKRPDQVYIEELTDLAYDILAKTGGLYEEKSKKKMFRLFKKQRGGN